MSTIPLPRRIAGGFALLFLVTAAVGAVSWWRLSSIVTRTGVLANDAFPSILAIQRIEGGLKDSYIAAFEHTLADGEDDMAGLEKRMEADDQQTHEAIEQYAHLLTDEEDKKAYEQLKLAQNAFLDARSRLVVASRANDNAASQDLLNGDLLTAQHALRDILEKLMQSNLELGQGATLAAEADARRGSQIVALTLGAAVISTLATALLLIRSTRRDFSRMADAVGANATQIAASTAQVSAASQTLAEGASSQAAIVEETSATLEELNGMTRRNAESADNAKSVANRARESATAGRQRMDAMIDAMAGIQHASTEISKILKTIDEIAFQTNILALNAAVEAARAGEAGAGFAVVAEEVRALAQRCTTAAKETAEKISDSVNKSNAGAELSEKVARELREIGTFVEQVDGLVAEIATASRQQSEGLNQLTSAVNQIDRATQSNAAGAEENAAAAHDLQRQATSLQETASQLRALAGLKRTNASTQNAVDAVSAPDHDTDDGVHSKTTGRPAVSAALN